MVFDPARIAAVTRVSFSGEGWRHLGPTHDPSSGQGARLHGGRFNPPESFPALYLCTSQRCAAAELQRLGQRQSMGVADLLPRRVYRYELQLDLVLDLTDPIVRDGVGIGLDALIGQSWDECQELGLIAHGTGTQGILSQSATGVDAVLAVFVDHVGPGAVQPTMVAAWNRVEDVPATEPR